MGIRLSTLLLLMTTCILYIGCSKNKVAGNDVLTGNPAISGIIYDAEGNPASETEVRLISVDYNPLTGENLDTLIDTTDSEGKYSFYLEDPGLYNIEARHISDQTRLLVQGVTLDIEETYSLSDTLKPASSIVLPIPEGFRVANSFVYIPGTTFLQEFQDTANFVLFDSIPEGNLPIVFVTVEEDSTPAPIVYMDTVKASPADTIRYPRYYAWNYSKKIGFNTTNSGTGNVHETIKFPVLLRFNQDNFDFTQTNNNGDDLRFSNNGEDQLPYEIERWDPNNELGEVWVLMDTVFGSTDTQTITMFWGNPKVENLSNSESVFDTSFGYGAVYHMNEDPNGDPALVIKDRTPNGLHASPTGGMTSNNQVESVIGKGIKFDDENQGIYPSSPDPGFFHKQKSSITISGWATMNPNGPDTALLVEMGGTKLGFVLAYIKDSNKILFDISEAEGVRTSVLSKKSFKQGEPIHVTGVYNKGRMELFINGMPEGSDSLADSIAYHIDGPGIGKNNENTFLLKPPGGSWRGGLDEIRFSSIPRQHRWIKMCYQNQRPDQTLVVW